jgi:uncharacterized protein YbaP (TraB family)
MNLTRILLRKQLIISRKNIRPNLVVFLLYILSMSFSYGLPVTIEPTGNPDSSAVSSGTTYPSLMWEITAPWIKKPSYLYGSMHVSRKVAFHLGDTFFMAMKNADVVALELNPAEWMESFTHSEYYRNQMISNSKHLRTGLYRNFYRDLFFPDMPDVRAFARPFYRRHNVMNHLLYRKSEATTDFEEITYLDLFIYQAGIKMGKPVIGMEDFEESRRMVAEAETPPDVRDSDEHITRESMTAGYRMGELIEDAYRKGDLDLLDSLIRMTQPWKRYYTWMIVKRNEVMVQTIDSVIRSGSSVFAAAGAAHLPGDSGMISMLRDLGYTLRPVTRHVNRSQHKAKEKLDKQFVKVPLQRWESPEGDFSLDVPGKLYSDIRIADHGEYYYPDMVNGSYYVVLRFPTFAPLRQHSTDRTKSQVDSLLYEFVPGKIERIRDREVNGFPAFDITATISRGDLQRYLVVFTPMEVILFKMSGPVRYMKRHRIANRFIASVNLHLGNRHEWTTVSPLHRGFSVSLPPYRIVDTTRVFETGTDDLFIQAWDFHDSSYYLLIKGSYHDLSYVEEDRFELMFLAEQLAEQYALDLQDVVTHTLSDYPALSFNLFREGEMRNYRGRIIMTGPEYYLLLSNGINLASNDRFFDSFELTKAAFSDDDFYLYRDTVMLFEVETLVDPPERRRTMSDYWSLPRTPEDNSHQREFLTTTFFHYPTAGVIRVEYTRTHKYHGYENPADLWDFEKGRLDRDTAFVVREELMSDSGAVNTLYIVLGDSLSSRTIHHKLVQHHGVVYRISAKGDTLHGLPAFARRFFDTFTPLTDTSAGWCLYADKGELFLNDLVNEDSVIRSQARQSLLTVKVRDHNAPLLMERISNPLKEEHTLALRRNLILKLGSLDHPEIPEFLKNLYVEVGDTGILQTAILRSLARNKSKEAMEGMLACFSYDVPLMPSLEVSNLLFREIADSLECAVHLFPEILQYTRYREYEDNIFRLLATLVDSSLIERKVWEDQYTYIFRNARDNWRRHHTRDQEDLDNQSEFSTAIVTSQRVFGGRYDPVLMTYLRLLIPFYHEQPEVARLFEQAMHTRTVSLQTSLAVALIDKGIFPGDSLMAAMSADPVFHGMFYRKLDKAGHAEHFIDTLTDHKRMAYSMMASVLNFEPSRDTMAFLGIEHVEGVLKGGDEGYVYFFRYKPRSERFWQMVWIGFITTDTTQLVYESFVRSRSGVRMYENDKVEKLMEQRMKPIRVHGRKRASGMSFRSDSDREIWF